MKNYFVFSHPISKYNININTKDVLVELKKIKYRSVEPFRGSWGSLEEEMNVLESLPKLKSLINKTIKNYIKDVLKYDVDFFISRSWAQKISGYGEGAKHYHANSWLSGVYYPIGNKNFSISFYNPVRHPWYHPPYEYNEYNSNTWTITCEDNMLVLFPSYLEHMADKNNSAKDRYSLAFNLIPKGPFGAYDSSLNLAKN